MKYDFLTNPDRRKQGSRKYMVMYNKNPHLSKDIIPLSVADMEFVTPPEIREGLKDFLDEVVLGYSAPNDEYFKALKAFMYRKHNFKIENDWVVNTNGVVLAFFNCVREFLKKDQGLIIMPPVYPPFFKSAKYQGRKLVECPLLCEDGYYTINYELFEKLASDKNNKALLFCSPHNPVGRVWKREELEKLGKIIVKNDLYLFADEIHSDIVMPGYEHTVFQSISDELSERTITFTAPSKTFNLAGLGVSSIIIKNKDMREKFVDGLEKIGAHVNSALAYKAAEIAYNECDLWLEEMICVIDKNQKIVNKFFKENYPKIKARLIEGTYLMWIDFRDLNMTYKDLQSFMENKAELFFNEGYLFGEEGQGFERINLALPEKSLKEALNRLDKALKEINYK